VAAVDCGTNSLRLLVADLEPASGTTNWVDRRTTIVRLGQGVDATGSFRSEALERTFAAIDEYADVIAELGAVDVRCVATSAARDVANRDVFLDGVRDRLGVEPEIISGDEEAQLSYDGATRELARHGAVDEPVLVVDIGGGSTEFVMRDSPDGTVVGQSLDIGSVRLTERRLEDDPPTSEQVNAAVRDVEDALATLTVPVATARTVVGVAGTVTTMGAMVLDLDRYDRDRVNGSRLASADVLAAVDEIVAMTVAERRALAFMHPDRADVIGAGALVLGGIVGHLGLPEFRASSHDLLDGIVWSLMPAHQSDAG
jgi:exopolyphosphatase/guanosine-5'-triphosphate,3'-diphosphate pyrophosphatase